MRFCDERAVMSSSWGAIENSGCQRLPFTFNLSSLTQTSCPLCCHHQLVHPSLHSSHPVFTLLIALIASSIRGCFVLDGGGIWLSFCFLKWSADASLAFSNAQAGASMTWLLAGRRSTFIADIVNENGGGGLDASRTFFCEPATGCITTLVVTLQSQDAITKRK